MDAPLLLRSICRCRRFLGWPLVALNRRHLVVRVLERVRHRLPTKNPIEKRLPLRHPILPRWKTIRSGPPTSSFYRTDRVGIRNEEQQQRRQPYLTEPNLTQLT